MPTDKTKVQFRRDDILRHSVAVSIFEADEGGHLASAVKDAIAATNSETSFAQSYNWAKLDCADALWAAIGKYNQFNLDRAMLSGGGGGNMRPDSKLRKTLKKSRTQHGKLRRIADEAGRLAAEVEDLIDGFDYLHRIGLVGRVTSEFEAHQLPERAQKRAIIMDEIHKLRGTMGLTTIRALLTELSTYRELGGAPGYVFHRRFAEGLLEFWRRLSGDLPRRGNTKFMLFLASAYYLVADDDFAEWESVLRTISEGYGET